MIFFGSDGGCLYGFAEFTPVAFPPCVTLAVEVISAPSFHVGSGSLDEEIGLNQFQLLEAHWCANSYCAVGRCKVALKTHCHLMAVAEKQRLWSQFRTHIMLALFLRSS